MDSILRELADALFEAAEVQETVDRLQAQLGETNRSLLDLHYSKTAAQVYRDRFIEASGEDIEKHRLKWEHGDKWVDGGGGI